MASGDERQGTGNRHPASSSTAGQGTRATSLDLLDALQAYRSAESGLRKELSQRLDINETDLAALRNLFAVWQAGGNGSPKELALALDISSASTTLVIDRLEKAGFTRRRRHPVDRRAVILEPGERATQDFRESFDLEQRRIIAAADTLTDDEAGTVTRFLRSVERAASDAVVGPQHLPDVH